MAHQQNQGVTARTVAPFSFDCEVIVKLTNRMRGHIVVGSDVLEGYRSLGGRMEFHALLDFIQTRMRMAHIYQPVMIRTLLDHQGDADDEHAAHELAPAAKGERVP